MRKSSLENQNVKWKMKDWRSHYREAMIPQFWFFILNLYISFWSDESATSIFNLWYLNLLWHCLFIFLSSLALCSSLPAAFGSRLPWQKWFLRVVLGTPHGGIFLNPDHTTLANDQERGWRTPYYSFVRVESLCYNTASNADEDSPSYAPVSEEEETNLYSAYLFLDCQGRCHNDCTPQDAVRQP